MKLKHALLYFGLAYGFGLCFIACANSAARVEEQNHSLTSIRKVIESVIGTPRSVTSNQRVYLSEYYGRKNEKSFDPLKSKNRQYTRISINGDRRPYDLDVDVIVERKNGSIYEEIGIDEKESEKVANALKDKLHQGLDGRNVIDDFRVF
jgi:hypothetical protein